MEDALALGVHPLFLVEEDYRLALLDAEAAFIDDFIDRITRPETGFYVGAVGLEPHDRLLVRNHHLGGVLVTRKPTSDEVGAGA